jgi:quercetin dioxygenase-like cupin family protein
VKLNYIRAGDDGESHLEELDLPMEHVERRATHVPIPATQFTIGESDVLVPLGWHHAPRRQLVAVLSGRLEVEVGDGTKKRFGPGDTFIADDLAGRGHLTRDLEGPVRLLYVHLPDDVDLDGWSRSG